MRELHDGVELLEKERDDGPFVWQTWDKWVKRCEEVIPWLDRQVLSGKQGRPMSRSDGWKKRGLICGVEWTDFKKVVYQYRQFVEEQYGGRSGIREHLIFAHNDVSFQDSSLIHGSSRPDPVWKPTPIRATWNITIIDPGK
jgi:choline kinase